jgi:hypothetical protein
MQQKSRNAKGMPGLTPLSLMLAATINEQYQANATGWSSYWPACYRKGQRQKVARGRARLTLADAKEPPGIRMPLAGVAERSRRSL